MTAHLEIALVLGVMFEGSGVPGLGAPTAPQPGTAVPSPAGPVLDREAESVGIRAVVEEVLARPEFADLHADPNAFGRWLMEWIGWLFKRLGSAIEGLPSGVLWSIVASMLLALLAILAHLIYTLWSIFRWREAVIPSRFRRAPASRGTIGSPGSRFRYTVRRGPASVGRRRLAPCDQVSLCGGDPLAGPSRLDCFPAAENQPRLSAGIAIQIAASGSVPSADGGFRVHRLRRPVGDNVHDARHGRHCGKSIT